MQGTGSHKEQIKGTSKKLTHTIFKKCHRQQKYAHFAFHE